jgi:type IV secretory pathway component VirB8
MRAFTKIRQLALTNSTLAKKIAELEKVTNNKFSKLDKEIKLIFEAIKQLIKTESKPKNPMGFQIPKK